jgi:hypothetical protein
LLVGVYKGNNDKGLFLSNKPLLFSCKREENYTVGGSNTIPEFLQ